LLAHFEHDDSRLLLAANAAVRLLIFAGGQLRLHDRSVESFAVHVVDHLHDVGAAHGGHPQRHHPAADDQDASHTAPIDFHGSLHNRSSTYDGCVLQACAFCGMGSGSAPFGANVSLNTMINAGVRNSSQASPEKMDRKPSLPRLATPGELAMDMMP